MLRDEITPLVMSALRTGDADAVLAAGALAVTPIGIDNKGMIPGQGGSVHRRGVRTPRRGGAV
eukprot:3652724-Prymnesium_polylepis.1